MEPEELDGTVDVAAYGVPYDGAVTNKPGTRYGPEAVRTATNRYSRVFDSDKKRYSIATDRTASYDGVTVRDCGDAPVTPNSTEETYESVVEYAETIAAEAMPVMIGGDHYLTYPAFVGYANAVEDDIGIIHLDAHEDIGSSDLYGEHYHGSPMSRIADTEYGGLENHAMVGIRGHSRMEVLDAIEEEGLHIEYAKDVHEKGIEACIENAIEHATDGVDHVYLTMDIDVVDPSYAPGTGTPAPGGITSNDLLRAADRLGECDAIGAVDLVEVLPTEDPAGTTSLVGANALSRFFESYFYEE
ncbi:agmatinase family protein [Natranaeroarchaeum aerophilus]|uniref:Agmatinase family protein n=1 Tax=Natranaeroarchaeum aerophilus TaxID=2917711 RepID=A0AAE3FQH7_9EURY|nr:agmatinase family protein [Natranaeroarchaeum aerophilus]